MQLYDVGKKGDNVAVMEYCHLSELIQELERGNRYHISVVFMNHALREDLRLLREHAIHATAFCDAVKRRPNGLSRCLRCRHLAIEKVRKTQKPFGGFCINGVYEYCYPVIRNQRLICVILVGNILRDSWVIARKSGIAPEDPILETMEPDMTEETCWKVAKILDDYIGLLLEKYPAWEKTPRGNVMLETLCAYIDRYYDQDITLGELARLFYYNEKYMGSLFKKQLGVSFHDYLSEKRLDAACKLLIESDDSVIEISRKTGFNSVSYFNRLFKKKKGISPTAYRKDRKK